MPKSSSRLQEFDGLASVLHFGDLTIQLHD